MKKRLAGLRRCRAMTSRRGGTPTRGESSTADEVTASSGMSLWELADSARSSVKEPSPSANPPSGQANCYNISGLRPNFNSEASSSINLADVAHGCNPMVPSTNETASSVAKRPASSELSPPTSKSARTHSPDKLATEAVGHVSAVLNRDNGKSLSRLVARTSLIPRFPRSSYSSSFIEEVLSLRSRFSVSTGSWRSSGTSSILTNIRNSKSGLSLNLQVQSSTVGPRDCWCCTTSSCLHIQLSILVESCGLNSVPPRLTGLNIIQVDLFRNGPLHLAAIEGATSPVFEALIAAYADIHATNAAGETFMHVLDPTNLLKDHAYFPNLLSLKTTSFSVRRTRS